MLIDTQLLFSDNQGPFAQGTNASTNYLDGGVARDIGIGEQLYWVTCVTTAVTGSGSTCDFKLQSDTDSGFATALITHLSTGALAVAALTAGTVIVRPLPPGMQRYVRVAYTVATADQSTGKFMSFLTRNVDLFKQYPRASYIQL